MERMSVRGSHSKLLDELVFIDGLLNMADRFHPLWRELLLEARDEVQRELAAMRCGEQSKAA